MNAAKITTQRVSRINTLLNKMLNTERSESASSRTESIDRVTQSAKNIEQRPSVNPNLKRNLFGVQLNHDQLKQDLNTMWKEQIEVQKIKWNFDFETLKPVEANERFRWSKCQVEETKTSRYVSTLFDDAVDKENVNSNKQSDMPQFYKQQRCLKLIDNITPVVKKQQDLVKPKPVKSKTNKLHGLNQIITFSENRKDTLRSASANTTKVVKSTNSAFTKNEKKTDNLKQQSLLDMLKQRKRRIQTNNGKPSKVANSNENEAQTSQQQQQV